MTGETWSEDDDRRRESSRELETERRDTPPVQIGQCSEPTRQLGVSHYAPPQLGDYPLA